ncbi:hypothetical protein A3F03_00015 [Candidatus Roizmanbacteria bacterium RIFCSPHIGHO2_12_FULL_41_11]|uniref:Glycosyl transferase family 1 domain-containing protein n=1 Tax=Candidatus Roizmanbacteria bacterium RIFCSPHIGHO2_12_FULL_41_11 TaxID=1802052 RepID=A0A1F7I2I9_9BACT|nr:MAG: hypothetical protein A3F03_00015 [Candidatus Roizmanbacteria bacterium RIFCSPHIGHO2_12_FULL_41_11]
MKIAVDGGALCGGENRRFGNYTFSQTVITGLKRCDPNNQYFVYTFCDNPGAPTGKNIKIVHLSPKLGWMKLRVALEELARPKDIFLGLNQALPFYTPAKKIVFSQGLSFIYHPQLYTRDNQRLKAQLNNYLHHADLVVVSSQKIKQELTDLFPEYLDKICVLAFPIPFGFEDTSKSVKKSYFLFMGMDHPVKNVRLLVNIFLQFSQKARYHDFQLVLCGPFQKYSGKRVIVRPYVGLREKKRLYQQAVAYFAPSLYESFNFPLLEALSQNCPVVGLKTAVIPELRPFVNLADTKEFGSYFELAAENKLKPPDRAGLLTEFSLKKFITNLTQLYS